MMESENVRLVRALGQAVSDYDFDKVEAMVADDIVVEQPFPAMGMPERMQGREQFLGGLRFVPTMFKEFKLTITQVYDCPDDNIVAFEQTSRGIFNVDGSEYRNRYMMIFGFRGGKVYLWKECYDSRIMTEKMTPIMAKMSAASAAK